MKTTDYIGLNLCLLIPYHYGFMSGYELIASVITIPFAIVWWTTYAVIIKEIEKLNKK